MFIKEELQSIKNRINQKAIQVLLVPIAISVASVFSAWTVLSDYEGMILFGFGSFLVSLVAMVFLMARNVEELRCPACGRDLIQNLDLIVKARICLGCEKRIVQDGRCYSKKVVERYRKRTEFGAVRWFFLFAICVGVSVFVYMLFFPPVKVADHNAMMIFPMLSLSSVWAWVRSFDRRLRIYAFCSMVLFVVSATRYWYYPI